MDRWFSPHAAPTALPSRARRRSLQVGLCALWATVPAWAVQKESLANPLRLGCDEALVNSGLAPAWQKAFARDTGVVVSLISEPVTRVLQWLERGEVDMSLTNQPTAEALLEKQGLAHDRQRVGIGEFVVVGPTSLRKALRLLPSGRREAPALSASMLMQVLANAKVPFLTRADDSGTHALEQSLWRLAQVNPEAPWYRTGSAEVPIWLQAREAGACTLVERGVWERVARQSGLVVLSDKDEALSVDLHLMRSFRVSHPAARLFTQWLGGPRGQAVVAKQAGYRSVGTP